MDKTWLSIFKFFVIIWTFGTWLVSTAALILAKGLLNVNFDCSLVWYYLLYLCYYNLIYTIVILNENWNWFTKTNNIYLRIFEIFGRITSIILNIFVIGGLIWLNNEDNDECLNGDGLYDDLVLLMIEIYCAWFIFIILVYGCVLFLPTPPSNELDEDF
jgi:hypothetical protein